MCHPAGVATRQAIAQKDAEETWQHNRMFVGGLYDHNHHDSLNGSSKDVSANHAV